MPDAARKWLDAYVYGGPSTRKQASKHLRRLMEENDELWAKVAEWNAIADKHLRRAWKAENARDVLVAYGRAWKHGEGTMVAWLALSEELRELIDE